MIDTANIYNALKSNIIARSNEPRRIAGRYLVGSRRLEKFDTRDAIAYDADDCLDQKLQCYALVFQDSNYQIRLSEIISLLHAPIKGLANPLAIGIASFGEEGENLVIIIQMPSGIPLPSILSKMRSEHDTLHNIALPVSEILESMHERMMTHGNINPNSIYIDGDDIMIGECISTLCGLNQDAFYESPERAQCVQYGKGLHYPHADYYALGMSLFYLYAAGRFAHEDVPEALIVKKSYAGTFSYIMNIMPLTGKTGECIRALSNRTQAMNYKILYDIINTSKSATYEIEEFIFQRPIILFEYECRTVESLAYALYINWAKARELIKSNQLATIFSGIKEISGEMKKIDDVLQNKIFKDLRIQHDSFFDPVDIQLAYILTILEPAGPIRIKTLAFHPSVVTNMMLANDDTAVEMIALLTSGVLRGISQFMSNAAEKECVDILCRNIPYLKQKTGFGIQRFLHESNHCLQYRDGKAGLFSLSSVLESIDQNTTDLAQLIENQALITFLASKIKYSNGTLYNHQLHHLNKSGFSSLIVILSKAQQLANDQKMPNIANLIASYLVENLCNAMHNKKMQQRLTETMDKIKIYGLCDNFLKILMMYDYLYDDKVEYNQAIRKKTKLVKLYNYYRVLYVSYDIFRQEGRKVAAAASCVLFLISITVIFLI